MFTCFYFRNAYKMDFNLLYKFFEGLTTQDEEKAIREWIEDSPENEARFFEERKMFDAILISGQKDLFEQENAGNILKTRPISKRKFYLQEVLKITAAILVALLGSWYYFVHIENDDDLMATQTINVPAGQRLNLVLPDGTDVWLNAKTTIKYPVSFNKEERLVTIDGQAFFNVAKNEKAPFIVKTANATVKALGTQFDVLDYSDSEEFETMLMEGRVEVTIMNKPEESLILNPNSKSILENGKLTKVYVDDFSSYEWKNGLISFKNKRFADIMNTFEKTYDIEIEIEKTEISNLLYTGKFRIIDGVDYALRVLQKDVGFRYERDTENHIIYIK